MRNRILLMLLLLAATKGTAAEDLVTKLKLKSVEQATNEFLASLPSDETLALWVRENGPVYGNYCGVERSDESFESPCLGRLDCVCKAKAFGGSLRRALAIDIALVERTLGQDAILKDQKPAYQTFLQRVSIKAFAAKLVSVDVNAQIKTAHNLFAKQPDRALNNLNKIIDENQIVRERIEGINVERIRFEEMRIEAQQISDWAPKVRCVSLQPLNILEGLFSINYEQAMRGIFSFRIGLSFLGAGLITDTYLGYGNNKDFSAFLGLGLKIFVIGQPLRSGIYLEPGVDVGYENVAIRGRPELPNIRDIAFVPDLMVGFEKVFAAGVQIDFSIGGGYHVGIPIADNPANIATMFVVPKARASVGWAW